MMTNWILILVFKLLFFVKNNKEIILHKYYCRKYPTSNATGVLEARNSR